ncbi:hypothetical protein MRX96_014083 [Rhipicephalus microplus]
MKLQEDEPPGEQRQYNCALTFPTSAQRSCETEEDEEEQRCSGTERRPFNAIRGCASGDYEGIAWYDSVNYRGVAGDIRKNHRAPPDVVPEFERFRNTRRQRSMRQSSARRLHATLRNRLALGTSLFFLRTELGTTKGLRNWRGTWVLTRCRSIGSTRLPTRPLPPLHAARLLVWQRTIDDRRGHATKESSSLSRNRRWSHVYKDAGVDRCLDHLCSDLVHGTEVSSSSSSEHGQRERNTCDSLRCCGDDGATMTNNSRNFVHLPFKNRSASPRRLRALACRRPCPDGVGSDWHGCV